MEDQVSIPMSLPLDTDGFLRRECPTCEREFKWLHSQSDEPDTPAPDDGYFCPYCGVQAPPHSWWTKAQHRIATARAYQEVIGPQLAEFQRRIERLNHPGGVLRVSTHVEPGEAAEMPTLVETDDMRRVDFECHDEPIKVLDGWSGPLHCLVCGSPLD
jgi:hypothetical protein